MPLALCALAWMVALHVPCASARAEEPGLDLAGAWYLIIHYTDESGANPEATRWLDRVWTFKEKGSRLNWVEYPIVVVSDQTGRFEAIAGNPRSRVLAGWTPNARQLEEILSGPHVNTRGSKSKSLRKTKAGGWATQGRAAVRSASVIGYQETWSIDDPATLPKFSLLDVVGGGTTKGDTGGSIYQVTAATDGGKELRGTYERDGVRRGTFRMLRTEPVRDLVTADDKRTVNERALERQKEEYLRRAQELEEKGELE